jgi:hypothetical protein
MFVYVGMEVGMSEQATMIVGFDLGHGETSLCRVNLSNDDAPQIIELYGEKKMVTAVARDSEGTYIGEKAVYRPSHTRLHVAFKQRPSCAGTEPGPMLDFIETIYQELIHSEYIERGPSTHFFVGCPSGWKETDRAAYEQLFVQAKLAHVTVVPESRAALMHARHSGLVGMEEIKSSVLVIDVGSSTTDFTLICDGQIKDDDGEDLGASIIDKAILEYSLNHHPNREALEAILREKPHYRSLCELTCRRAKEEYFTHPDFYTDPDAWPNRIERVEKHFFEPMVNGEIMHELLNRPLVNGKGWVKAFRDSLMTVKAKYARMQISPATIIITGGASRMGFISETCREVFPEARYCHDKSSDYGVADGLARWGQFETNATRFLQEVGTYLDYELVPFIEGHIPTLVEGIADNFTDRCAEIIKTHYKEWREGKIDDIASIPERTTKDIKAWAKSNEARQLVDGSVLTWLSSISARLSQEIEKTIGQKYGIPLGAIQLSGSMAVNNVDVSLNSSAPVSIEALGVALYVGGVGVIGAIVYPIAQVIGGSIPFVGNALVAASHSALTNAIGQLKESPPKMVRRAFLADRFLNRQVEKQKPAIRDPIREAITNDQATIQQLVEQVRVSLREEIETKAEEARWLVTRGG